MVAPVTPSEYLTLGSPAGADNPAAVVRVSVKLTRLAVRSGQGLWLKR